MGIYGYFEGQTELTEDECHLNGKGGTPLKFPVAGKTGHWYRHYKAWPTNYCYEGDVCVQDRIYTPDGWGLTYGGPQSCMHAGFTKKGESVDKFGGKGVYYYT
uniref:Uncharacterized protein n=1 Tax=Eutreptiella gymnastica TaxID=73025 RepID=A0A7S4GJF5_9EUGL|mmetsp:Transcript_11394/g.20961  ORF Transcript_11394/g.20961 Transcript_11394/m.20961 type:complete len:103 (+) Transcript_11394:34-342(+)|eukprot:CAMPEP_0174282150 /NCGR_PEP_ID=MMETSP0809-20121228/2621_1 /TAXON_ID=73025 ORGANISM="Eutreptiella gymnastica-like, Strain CCMP1594" /NCGR_SAMPLE_ID=MMETSP0809 /ASSEMBLY_ACC=CAM_ASM_000658 /LENGTH=102 /DNA_ID=CAMNT_0015376161 /DNA_START=32 /DNA_END=340 /DNA_ORIENTATION=+